ncbi:hypothetical protein MRX96_008430 [Rhipicephalus microplus]
MASRRPLSRTGQLQGSSIIWWSSCAALFLLRQTLPNTRCLAAETCGCVVCSGPVRASANASDFRCESGADSFAREITADVTRGSGTNGAMFVASEMVGRSGQRR